MIKVLFVSPAFYPATYWGGPIQSVYDLCNSLVKIPDVSLKVLTTDTAGPSRKDSVELADLPDDFAEGYDVYFCHRWFGLSVAPGLIRNLWSMVKWADVVHLTAVYSFPTIPTLFFCRMLGKPVVWTPRGALQKWKGSSNNVLKYLWMCVCNILIKNTNIYLHTTSEKEALSSRNTKLNINTVVIPNGVKIPKSVSSKEWRSGNKLRLLYIGRLHPIKGIENLLKAVKLLDIQLVSLAIYGDGDKTYLGGLRQLVKELEIEEKVTFEGHVNGEAKRNAFLHADICVVPSYSENFGMVVAEALAYGIPVIASKGTPWYDLEAKGCGLWVDNSPDALVKAIKYLEKKDLADLGKKGKKWMEEEFRWDSVANKIYGLYLECMKLKSEKI